MGHPPSYTYNAENQLVSTAGVNYNYDGDGKRVSKPNLAFWYAANSAPLEETSGGSGAVTDDYVFFGGVRIAALDPHGDIFAYFDDHLGSAHKEEEIASGASSATLSFDTDYYPFGRENRFVNNVTPNYQFTGKMRDDESGLDDFGARYYSSTIGRFTSTDAINLTEDRLVSPGTTLNKYVYAGDNPLKYVDPDGKDITIFYRAPSCTLCTDFGHVYIAAFNQDTGQVGFLNFGPLNQHEGNGPGQFYSAKDEAADLAKYSSLTIQTTPEEAQKVLDFIKALTSQPAPDYHWLSTNCTTICEDALHDLGLDLKELSPTHFWNAVYRRFSKDVQNNPLKAFPFVSVPHQPGVDYGNPRDLGVGNFEQFLYQLFLNQQQQLTVPEGTVHTIQGAGQPCGGNTGVPCG